MLVAAGHVPDKVVYLSAPNYTIVKAVPEGEDVLERKKALISQLDVYRRHIEKVVPIFSHVSKEFELECAYASEEACKNVVTFLDSKAADPGLGGKKK